MTPQMKTVLTHLQRRGNISPMEALTVYGICRLASRVCELRDLGYGIKTNLKRDDTGHKYARYEYIYDNNGQPVQGKQTVH